RVVRRDRQGRVRPRGRAGLLQRRRHLRRRGEVGADPEGQRLMALTVSIVSAAEEVWTGEATQVIAKTTEGEIGILKGHEPVLAVLADEGTVRVTESSGTVHTVEAADDFLSVDHDRVEIVARNAKLA